LFGYKIYLWTNEGKPLEPIHVHVLEKTHKNATKIWILSSGGIKVENNNKNCARIRDIYNCLLCVIVRITMGISYDVRKYYHLI